MDKWFVQGRRQSVCLGRAKCLATAKQAQKKKVAGGGGGGGGGTPTLFRLQKKIPKNYHNGVGVLSTWT